MKARKFVRMAFVPLVLLCLVQKSYAQDEPGYSDSWYVGTGLGFQFTTMRFSDLDENRFPSKSMLSSPLFSLFVQKEFGQEHQFVVRPGLTFLKRGGTLEDIDKFDGYASPIKDISYRLKSHYIDVRVPLLYQFGKATSGIRPYAGITPILGISTGGNIRYIRENEDHSISGYQVDLNNKNFASTYFALAPTVGVRFNFRAGRHAQNVLFVNLEASYEWGLSDTYGSDEKDGKAVDVISGGSFKFDGSRKFSGFSVQATIGIPFGAFKRSAAPTPPVYVEPRPVVIEPVESEKPCYTLEEIESLMREGKSVKGKTICSISDINFEYNKSSIQKSSYLYLNQLAETLIRTNANIEVRGHTDNTGTSESNMKLSKARAESVMKYLVKQGVSKDKISYSYYGDTQPLSDNNTESGRAMNRRVEFEILK